jgi:hypothetical protein
MTYGICNAKQMGVKRTVIESSGVNRKYKAYIMIKTNRTTTAHSNDKAYMCATITRPATKTMTFAGRKEHSNARISTIAGFLSFVINPTLLFTNNNVISMARNFRTGTIYASKRV